MKQLLIYFVLIICSFRVSAQDAQPDNEKLLLLYQNQRYVDAVNYLKALYPEMPSGAAAIGQLAYGNYMAGNFAEAEKCYLELYRRDPSHIPTLLSLAKVGMRRSNKLMTRNYLEKVLELDTTNFSVYKQLSDVITSPAEARLKLRYLEKANKLRPEDGDVANNLAELYEENSNFQPAYSVLSLAIQADSANVELLKTKLRICFQLKKLDEAVRTGESILFYGDSSTYVMNTIGKTAYQLKQYQKALKIFSSIDASEANETTWYYLTHIYKQLKDYPNAIKSLNAAITNSISPNVPNYYALLGALQESSKRPTEALEAYKKVLFFGTNGTVYYNLGLLYDLSLKNKKQAGIYYQKFLKSGVSPKVYRAELEYAKNRLSELKK